MSRLSAVLVTQQRSSTLASETGYAARRRTQGFCRRRAS